MKTYDSEGRIKITTATSPTGITELFSDVTAGPGTGAQAATIANDVVSNAKLANVATATFKGRTTAGTGDPEDLTATQATALLNPFTDLLKGLAPASGGGTTNFLRADGTWTTAPDTGITQLTGDVTAGPGSGSQIATIANDAVTFAKMQNIGTDRLIGRDTAASGDPEEISLGVSLEFSGSQSIQRAALTGDVTAAANGNATTIAANAVTDTKLRDSGALSVIGRSANSTGDPADISATAATDAVLRESGSVLGFGTIATAGIANNAVTDAKLRDSVGISVIGRATNISGDPADIQAVLNSDAVLRESLGVVGFGTVVTAGIANTAVTYAKIQNVTTDRLLGRDTAGSGVTEELTASGGIEFTGGPGIQRSALTGDVTASAGSNATTIANDAVTFAKMQNIATDSLIGRDTAGTGDPENILLNATLGMDGSGNLQRAALTGDVTASAGSNATTIANNAVTDAKFRQGAARSVVGVTGNATANTADIQGTTDQVLRVTGAGTALSFGAIDLSKVAAATGVLQAASFPALTGDVTTVAGALAATLATTLKVVGLEFIIDGGGSAITTGQKGHIEIPFACTINRVTLLADQTGSVVVDIWKDTYANFPPTVADTITAAAKPTLSSAQSYQDATLTGWTTSIAAGDILAYNIDSAATLTRLTVSLKVTRT